MPMICLHDSSEVIARTHNFFVLWSPVVKRWRFFSASLSFQVYSIELIFAWCWLKIVIIKTKFANFKKCSTVLYFIKVKFRWLLAMVGHCRAWIDYTIRKHYSSRFGRYCILSTNHRESIYFAYQSVCNVNVYIHFKNSKNKHPLR